jgi:hypothetical protein
MPWTRGQTALIVPVPEADPAVAEWRDRYDRSAPMGVPAHISVLVPWIPEPELTDPVPHLTGAELADPIHRASLAAQVRARLPIEAVCSVAWLMAFGRRALEPDPGATADDLNDHRVLLGPPPQ